MILNQMIINNISLLYLQGVTLKTNIGAASLFLERLPLSFLGLKEQDSLSDVK